MALTKNGVERSGYTALYSFHDRFANKEQDLLSRLINFQRGDYYVTFRITYEHSGRDAAEKQITDFIDKLAWPVETPGKAASEICSQLRLG